MAKVKTVNLEEIKETDKMVEFENVEKYGTTPAELFKNNQRLVYVD